MRYLLLLIITCISTSPVFAQSSGTPEDQRACFASVQQFCSKVVQGGDMAILACLQENRSRIAPACQQVLIKYGQ